MQLTKEKLSYLLFLSTIIYILLGNKIIILLKKSSRSLSKAAAACRMILNFQPGIISRTDRCSGPRPAPAR